MTNSSLLEFLLDRANGMRRGGGLSANHFVAALLELISLTNRGEHPAELDAEALIELASVKNVVDGFGISEHAALAEEILRRTASAPFSLDGFNFKKIKARAEEKAKLEGATDVTARAYLDLIFEEPTDVLSELVVGKAGAAPVAPTSVEGSAEPAEGDSAGAPDGASASSGEKPAGSFAERLRRQLNGGGSDLTAESGNRGMTSSDGAAPVRTDRLVGQERLIATVNNTKRIQDMLLSSIFGQDQAVTAFVSGYFQSELNSFTGKKRSKPAASFLFAGPPGVGKTYLAEKAAEALGLPYRRFDMSEYSDNDSLVEFCGSDNVYKNGKPGNVTDFVAKNPHCVLLFDEIEKAHISIIYLFLQILDAGRIRDNFTDEEVSFSRATIIFTTNVGKNLYEDPSVINLSSIPRKKVLKALSTDLDPVTRAPLFPAAICSRFASGNVVMFNHLGANNLFTIAKRELDERAKDFESTAGIKMELDPMIPTALLLSEGGKADARTVKGRAGAFFHEELYELLRLLSASGGDDALKGLEKIKVDVCLDGADSELVSMFVNSTGAEVLIFADEAIASRAKRALQGVTVHTASNIADAKDILFNHDVSVILADITCDRRSDEKLLNIEDVNSVGREFISYALEAYATPVYLLTEKADDVSTEEFLSLAGMGVRDHIVLSGKRGEFRRRVLEKCDIAYQQGNMLKLARENKVLTYRTSQTLSRSKKTAEIHLFDFHLALATDIEDSASVLDNVSRPNLSFADVIGAEDAKGELEYFVKYLKDPVKYMRMGVKAPKGILLYGPPGTGKTLLAKAMAGESDVTFLTAEGNQFLKRYVGEGAEAVHAIFAAARKYAPSILFVDEIDAIGKNRATASSDINSDVLTAFLTEMDGFKTDTSKPVFVLAATNYEIEEGRGRSLDPALLRRFDRRILVDLPNKEERKRYIQMKISKNATLHLSDAEVDNIAVRSTGMSLAELESVFEMALRSAIRSESGVVGDDDVEEAFETFNSGERKEWSQDSLIRTARHEAGHALLSWLGGDKPSYLTIVARGDHGGYMQHGDREGKGMYTKPELLARIRTSLGGRAAELVYYGECDGLSTGPSGDLATATRIAEGMICHYGMDDEVGLSYLDGEELPSEIRARVNAILESELAYAVETVEKNRDAIDAIVEALMERTHLKEDEMDAIFSSKAKR